MYDLCDDVMKILLRVNDAEFDFMLEQMTEDESEILSNQTLSISDMRKVIEFRNRYLMLYQSVES
jgi:hypothetical protein